MIFNNHWTLIIFVSVSFTSVEVLIYPTDFGLGNIFFWFACFDVQLLYFVWYILNIWRQVITYSSLTVILSRNI